MLRILVADDEILIRKMVVSSLCTIGIKQENIFEAGDGEELLAALDQHYFDAVLVDIKMPLLNGLDAIRIGVQKYPSTNFYVLSGYSDFQYVQEALRMGVKDYCLKPVSREKLKEILSGCDTIRMQNNMVLKHQLRNYAIDLFDGNIDEKTYAGLVGKVHSIYAASNCITREKSLYDLLNDYVLEYEALHNELIFYLKKQREDVLIVALNQSCDDLPYTLFFEDLHRCFPEECLVKIDQAACDTTARLAQLLLCRPMVPLPHIFDILQANDVSPYASQICGTIQQMLESYLSRDYVSYNAEVEGFSRQLDEGNEHRKEVMAACAFVGRMFAIGSHTPAELIDGLLARSNDLVKPVSNHDLPEKITEYINNSFQYDIGVNDVASHFSLSPNYVSQIFKKKMGISILDYLTKLRMETSKKMLLETTLSIKEIATSVGYLSSSYYIRKFVKYTGITPNEFRLKNQK